MSKTVCYYPMVGALLGALEYLKSENGTWRQVNDTQKDFLSKFYADATSEVPSMKELETKASSVAAEINEFLASRGFTIKLEDFAEDEFGVASILDVLVEWVEKGHRRKVQHNNEFYDATYLDDNFSVFTAPGHKHPIARLDTKKDGEYLFITKASKELENLELMTVVKDLEAKAELSNENYDGVLFPMVDLNQEVNIDWLKKMFTLVNKDKWEIAQALQQTKFRMNEEGARAESAVALSMRCASAIRTPPILRIDEPFFVWISRKGLSMPFFAGYITPEDWKDPKTLADKKE